MTTYESGDVIMDGKGNYWHYDDEDVEPGEPGEWVGHGGSAVLPLSSIPTPHKHVYIISKERFDTLADYSELLFILQERGVSKWSGYDAAVEAHNLYKARRELYRTRLNGKQ